MASRLTEASLADRGVRAPPGLDPDDAVGGERVPPDEELGVLAGVDVVGDDGHLDPVAEPEAQGLDQGGLPRADRAADADLQGGRDHDRNRRASSCA
jgi:hypothetical protein